jgi:hypothetical protein
MERYAVLIDEVDPNTQIVQVVDSRGGKFSISYATTAGSLLIPKKGEYWLAERADYEWVLSGRYETSEDKLKIADLNPGDNRLLSSTVVRISAPSLTFNDQLLGVMTWDRFEIPSQGLSSIILTKAPISPKTIMAFSNGRLLDPTLLTLAHNVLIGNSIRFAAGVLVVHYQFIP